MFTSIAFCILFLAEKMLFNVGSNTDNVVILIKPNDTGKQFIHQLMIKNVIQNKLFFQIFMKIFSIKIRAGEYIIPPKTYPMDIQQLIDEKKSLKRKIRIPDGSTAHEVTEIITNTEGIFGDIPFIEEGSILPDTYFFTYGDSAYNIVSYMQKCMTDFAKQWFNVFCNNIADIDDNEKITNLISSYKTFIILASIVEKECIPEEMPIIAGIFINRLKINMRLQSCASAAYERKCHNKSTKYQSDYNNFEHSFAIYDLFPKRSLYYSNKYKKILKLSYENSENNLKCLSIYNIQYNILGHGYNTYKFKGLPITAICNPSKKAIIAVANFASHKLLYFRLQNKSKTHHFSEDFKDHKQYKVIQCRKEKMQTITQKRSSKNAKKYHVNKKKTYIHNKRKK